MTVVVEGVMMYLEPGQVRALMRAIRATFSRVTLLADLMTYDFFRKYGGPLHAHLAALGAVFKLDHGHPRRLVEEAGFRALAAHSIVGRAIAERAFPMPIPRWALDVFLRTMRDGYAVWEFQAP